MKVKLLLVFSLFVNQFSFSQTEKTIKGKVLCDNVLLENVNVINKTSKISTATNEKGEFIIQAKANDSLFFYAKEYHLKKIKVTSGQIDQNNLVVLMFKKPEELEEVVITKLPSINWKVDKVWEQEQRNKIRLDKAKGELKTGVYDGRIEGGVDFMLIGKMIASLFAKEKKEEKETAPKIEFSALAKSICEENFFLETLKLKQDQIDLFLQFCEVDPKSIKLIQEHNTLSMMDFLLAKNIEFQKLNGFEK